MPAPPSAPTDTTPALQPPLIVSVAATAAVLVVPGWVAYRLFIAALAPARPGLALVTALLLAGALSLVGSVAWESRPQAEAFSFGDLMLWHWLRRHRAERRIVANARRLGFSRTGAYLGAADDVPPKERLDLLGGISLALDAKSSYTYKHTDRVERVARRLGEAMGLPRGEVEDLAVAALLHDVGNIRIPERILRTPRELSDAEREVVESHTVLGALMAYGAGPRRIADGILYHHERWDGKGYPNGVAGEEIPLFARIVSLAEAYDAMTSTRSYRDSVTPRTAIDRLRDEAGRQFDPQLVGLLEGAMPRLPLLLERAGVPAGLQARAWEMALALKRVGATALLAAVVTVAMGLALGEV